MPRVLTETDVADFRERLCAAAEVLFAQHGPDGVTMRQLAAALGVSPMTPYRYFKDKDAILAAVRASGFNRFAQALEGAYDSETEPLARTKAVGDAYVDFALSEPAAYRLMFDLMQPCEGEYPELLEAETRARRTLTRHIEGVIDAGLLRGDAVMIAHMFWTILHGTIVLQLAGKLSPDIDPGVLRRETSLALMRGLSLGQPA
jgi:AcrR family transcriptional regulator